MIDDNFKNKGYTVVKSAISEELRDFVTQYALFDEMQDIESSVATDYRDDQVPEAYSKYADPAMETVLLKLHGIMEDITGLNLYPTYSYYRVYRQGDELKNHTDRPSCEISATLCFNYSYQKDTVRFPIVMDGNPIVLEPGDMAVYKGCVIPHWREKFNCTDADWQVQGFFHYVDANGPYKDYKFDKRPIIGCPVSSKDDTIPDQKINNDKTKSYIEYVR